MIAAEMCSGSMSKPNWWQQDCTLVATQGENALLYGDNIVKEYQEAKIDLQSISLVTKVLKSSSDTDTDATLPNEFITLIKTKFADQNYV